ncbi:MAG: hypothetical protein IK085_05480 [Clostridia bacterium]|nr:hypothetical protein [Clostridia bacterium]
MKTNDEIFELVISRRDEHNTEKRKRKNLLAAVAVTAVCLCTATGIAVNQIRAEKPSSSPGTAPAQSETATEQTYEDKTQHNNTEQKIEISVNEKERAEVTTSAAEESTKRENAKPESVTETADSGYSTGGNGFFIPAVPAAVGAKPGINITGEKITDSEAAAYFDENKPSIVSALAASGVPADDIKISAKGYSHVSYDGTEGKQLELRQNFRDYPVYNGDRLVAIITLTKENGRLYSTPVFGAPWFDSYGDYLNAHKGQKLLYVYPKNAEIVIAPDGSYRSTAGYEVPDYFEGVDNPYQYFYSEAATYTP